ncbi:zinc finger protein 26-like [Drosophila eugracilis]|uniref:zinc finger protein 26-like n=1 Tax=Drosophila eugracilis TaxID=29029 RepID=UPI0007E73851|nr:zinc finger protein 26-like [Drosophila eugracilis]
MEPVCRVCLASCGNINIFEGMSSVGVSIAIMISECTGFKLKEGDLYPDSICICCLKDAEDAFEIKHIYERSTLLFSQLRTGKDPQGQMLTGSEFDRGPYKVVGHIKEEVNLHLLQGWDEQFGDQCQVKNEPLTEDIMEEDYPFSECKTEEFECQVHLDNNLENGLGGEVINTNDNVKLSNKISYCPKTLPSKSKDKRKKFKCCHCSKIFSKNAGLVRHLKTHTSPDLFKCSVCAKSFVNDATLQKHSEIHEEKLQDVTNYVPNNNLGYDLRNLTRERLLKCTYCSETFTRNLTLKIHLREHNEKRLHTQVRDLKLQKQTHKEQRPFKCSHCSKSFTSKSTLQVHTRSHTGERPFKCSICSKSFTQCVSLNVHLRTHTGEKSFKCTHCPKAFATASSVQVHIRTHTGEKPYKCSFCKKSFTQTTSLNVHTRTHTGELPFKCNHCSKAFSTTSSLQIHVRTHTGERPYKCSFCSKGFTQSNSLKVHLRTHN